MIQWLKEYWSIFIQSKVGFSIPSDVCDPLCIKISPPGVEFQDPITVGHRRATFANKIFPHQLLEGNKLATDKIIASKYAKKRENIIIKRTQICPKKISIRGTGAMKYGQAFI